MRAILFSLFVTVALAAAAGFVGVLAGRTLADGPGQYERGVDEGERLGRAQARATFKAGDPDFDAAIDAARSAAFAEGRREGTTIGTERGHRRGRASAFQGFDWQIGRWYLVNIAPDGADVRIGARVPLKRGQWYGACAEPSGLCRRKSAATTTRTSN